MKLEMSFSIAPRLSPDEICEQCVNEAFDGKSCPPPPCPGFDILVLIVERLYRVQHPQFVSQFQEVGDVDEDSMGFWISKQWLRG